MSWRRQYAFHISLRSCALALAVSLAIATIGGFGVYLLRAPILTYLGGRLVDGDPIVASDAIVILAGGVPEREMEAADLYLKKHAPRIVVTRSIEKPLWATLRTQGIDSESELDRRLRVLRTLGVPSDAITVLDPLVQSTIGEAQVVEEWARSRSVRSIIVVTSAFHTRRAKVVYRKVLARDGISLCVRATPYDTVGPETWWMNRIDLLSGLIEWQKTIAYWVLY